MVENDQDNEEYKFEDLDVENTDVFEENTETSFSTENTDVAAKSQPNLNSRLIIRNALIVLGGIIFMMVLYKFIASVFFGKKTIEKAAVVAPPVTTVTLPPEPIPKPLVQAESTLVPSVDKDINQKLSVLEVSQQSLRSDISSTNNQLNGINSNLSTINSKFAELNATINSLAAKIEEQSHQIDQLTAHRQVKKIRHRVRTTVHYPKYFLQAVIPGRAWLIATNGATLTVREGNTLAGYGVIKLIDPNQGRVITSSGQIIKFSQEDS